MRLKTDINDTVFSRLVRHKADWKCGRCGRSAEVGSTGIHASHFIGRANRKVRFDFDNVDALCYGCHQWMETHKGSSYREWKIKKLGEKRFNQLVDRSRNGEAPDKNQLKELRAIWRKELREKYYDTR